MPQVKRRNPMKCSCKCTGEPPPLTCLITAELILGSDVCNPAGVRVTWSTPLGDSWELSSDKAGVLSTDQSGTLVLTYNDREVFTFRIYSGGQLIDECTAIVSTVCPCQDYFIDDTVSDLYVVNITSTPNGGGDQCCIDTAATECSKVDGSYAVVNDGTLPCVWSNNFNILQDVSQPCGGDPTYEGVLKLEVVSRLDNTTFENGLDVVITSPNEFDVGQGEPSCKAAFQYFKELARPWNLGVDPPIDGNLILGGGYAIDLDFTDRMCDYTITIS